MEKHRRLPENGAPHPTPARPAGSLRRWRPASADSIHSSPAGAGGSAACSPRGSPEEKEDDISSQRLMQERVPGPVASLCVTSQGRLHRADPQWAPRSEAFLGCLRAFPRLQPKRSASRIQVPHLTAHGQTPDPHSSPDLIQSQGPPTQCHFTHTLVSNIYRT